MGICALPKWREYLKQRRHFRPIRLLYLRLRNRYAGLPHWRVLRGDDQGAWRAAVGAAGGPRVLVASSVGAHMAANALDSLLAVALTLRGARVHGLLCDRALPACLACESTWWPDAEHFVTHGPQRTLCHSCFSPAAHMWSDLGLVLKLFGDHVTEADRITAWRVANETREVDLDNVEYLGVRVGMHARSGALRYFAIGNFSCEPNALVVRRRFLAAALIATTALDRLFAKEGYDVCVAHHGIYVPQGLLVDIARKYRVRLVTWNIAYRAGSFIFSHDDSYHFTLMDEPTSVWENMSWSPAVQHALDIYMHSRAAGTMDWVSYHDGTGQSLAELKTQFGIDFDKPTVTAFTNVLWDAQVFYPSNAFASMLDWLIETIRYFGTRQDLQLVIRVHPAEVKNPIKSRETVVGELTRLMPQLPPNVFIIPPTASANSYAIARASNAAIIYGTKMGVELAYMGIPTIVAGESWARNKGITLDVHSREGYLALLGRLPFHEHLDAPTKFRAARYAFHFFFRRTIPLEFLRVHKNAWPPFNLAIETLGTLRPGRSLGLDIVCDGILKHSPFIYPAEAMIECGRSSHELVCE